jgi:hypothetical protein
MEKEVLHMVKVTKDRKEKNKSFIQSGKAIQLFRANQGPQLPKLSVVE